MRAGRGEGSTHLGGPVPRLMLLWALDRPRVELRGLARTLRSLRHLDSRERAPRASPLRLFAPSWAVCDALVQCDGRVRDNRPRVPPCQGDDSWGFPPIQRRSPLRPRRGARIACVAPCWHRPSAVQGSGSPGRCEGCDPSTDAPPVGDQLRADESVLADPPPFGGTGALGGGGTTHRPARAR